MTEEIDVTKLAEYDDYGFFALPKDKTMPVIGFDDMGELSLKLEEIGLEEKDYTYTVGGLKEEMEKLFKYVYQRNEDNISDVIELFEDVEDDSDEYYAIDFLTDRGTTEAWILKRQIGDVIIRRGDGEDVARQYLDEIGKFCGVDSDFETYFNFEDYAYDRDQEGSWVEIDTEVWIMNADSF